MPEHKKSQRSAERSGDGAGGFGEPVAGKAHKSFTNRQSLFIAIALVAVLFIYAADDFLRSRANAESDVRLAARYVAAELANSDAASIPTVLSFLARQVPDGAKLFVVSNDGKLLAATGSGVMNSAFDQDNATTGAISAAWAIAGGPGQVIVALPEMKALQPFLLRLGGATGLAILLMVIARRRPEPVVPAFLPIGVGSGNVLETLPFGVARWSSDGRLLGCNRHYRSHLGLSENEARLGNSYIEAMGHVTGNDGCTEISSSANSRLTEIERQDGTCLLVDERPLAEGGFITLVTDISRQKLTEKQLRAVRDDQRALAQQLREEKIKAESASRAKTSFLAHLSHDIRTPLNHIIGFADLIAHQTYGPVGDKRYLNYIKDIKTAGERLLESFAEILELAQLEGGHLILRRENFDVSEVIHSTANRFQATAERAGIVFDISVPSATQIYADKLCVERMLGNIVENAIRFTPSGGRVKLAAWTADDGIVLEISDTGIGITQDRLQDLSQPFVLGDAAFTREGGVGLGIAISRAIAELSGGNFAIDSSPAVGTTVAISLPSRSTQNGRIAHAA